MRKPSGAADYLLVTLSYLAFTLTDGAMRMLVLLHLHAQGETAWGLALILLPYEAAGVFTNLLSGFLGARFGLKPILTVGLLLQAGACLLLAADPARLSITYVALTQILSGVAKDFVKNSAKSYVKALQPENQGARLFRWVAWMTGSKNAMKGVGFFAGGALLGWVGFSGTNLGLGGALIAASAFSAVTLPSIKGRANARLRGVVLHDTSVLWLSGARLFLFGSRDTWFAVALPLFLASAGWPSITVGAVLAGWVVCYGAVQAFTPSLTRASNTRAASASTARWTLSLLLPLAPAALALWFLPNIASTATVLLAVSIYGVFFAVTSSLHSWLIVAAHDGEKLPERVGFYYAANAAGRLVGTACSGALFSAFPSPERGMAACIGASCCAAIIAAGCTRAHKRRLA